MKKEISTILKISLWGLILSFSIFFFSTYKPTLFGFDNRNLGAVRLFASIGFACLLLLMPGYFPKKLKAGLTSLFLFLIIISNISIKNAWIYASDFNNKMFSDLAKDIQEKNYSCVSIDYDCYNFLKNNDNLVLREPTFFNKWEAKYLCLKNGINPEQTKVYNTERHKCAVTYQYPSRKFVTQ